VQEKLLRLRGAKHPKTTAANSIPEPTALTTAQLLQLGCGRKFLDMACAAAEVDALLRNTLVAAAMYPAACSLVSWVMAWLCPVAQPFAVAILLGLLAECACRLPPWVAFGPLCSIAARKWRGARCAINQWCADPLPQWAGAFVNRAQFTRWRTLCGRVNRSHKVIRSAVDRGAVRPRYSSLRSGRAKSADRARRRARKRNRSQTPVDPDPDYRSQGFNKMQTLANTLAAHYELQAAAMDLQSCNICCDSAPGATIVPTGPFEDLGDAVVSWRNHRSILYQPRWGRALVASLLRLARSLSTILVVVLLCSAVVPIAASPRAVSNVRQMFSVASEVNYLAADNAARFQAELAALKQLPYEGEKLARQYDHGINTHLPHGESGNVNPGRYEKDPVSKLSIDRVPGVTDEQFESMRSMLQAIAPDVVAYDMSQITGYRGQEPPLSIDLDTTAPIREGPRRDWSTPERAIIDEKCLELLEHGIVRKIATSLYACNPVLAMKRAPDGTWSDKRFCVNFIPINKHTEPDRYGSHRADYLFERVVRGRFMTALDLRSGFHQIPMHEDSVEKTAFWYVSGQGAPPQLLGYQRMPFGLRNAPAKFQRVMDGELARAGCTDFAFAYIDDLIIVSDTYEEHVEHVSRVLRALAACNLKIHPDKSVFGTNIVEYLGHNVVGTQGITMNEAKVEAIRTLPDPTNVPELRSILGFLTYYRHFIPGYAALSAPLTDLLRKDRPWEWGERQRAAYATLKREMTQEGLVLRPIDPNRPLIVHTDWSVHGIGAVLGQKDDEGREYMCAAISRSLNKHERNYPSYKGELLALAWAVRMFRQHLQGTAFQLVTDHQPLLWIMKAKGLSGQYARWQMMLQEYDFEIQHRAGANHQNADVLSRFPRRDSTDRTGACLDPDVLRRSVNVARHFAMISNPLIDSIAPRFSDLFHKGVTHVEGHYYMDAAMRDPTPDELHPELVTARKSLMTAVLIALAPVVDALKHAITGAVDATQSALGQLRLSPEEPGSLHHALDTRVVGPSFFGAAKESGISLMELCGGICTGLDALLRLGIRINRYHYVDNDKATRQVAQFRLTELSARYPEQFPITAWTHAFDLPQDVRMVTNEILDDIVGPVSDDQYLVIAGWPCQEYSPAGNAQVGDRAALLDDVLRIVQWLQTQCHSRPPAYLLENVAMQRNFRHEHIRRPVFLDLLSRIGEPITFDAVQVGSRAHRLRNYWTNLCDGVRADAVFKNLRMYVTTPLTDILGRGRTPTEVAVGERSQSGVIVNIPGEPRRVLPTIMSFPLSRAFLPRQPGSLFDANTQQWDEPNAEERETAMGYDIGATAAPGVTGSRRNQMLGQAMDLRAVQAVYVVAQSLCHRGCAADPSAIKHGAKPPARCFVLGPRSELDEEDCPLVLPMGHSNQESHDIWFDEAALESLQGNPREVTADEASRIRKRLPYYRWDHGQLYRTVRDKLTNRMALRIVPRPERREDLILALHAELGHIGEKRTIDAVAQLYWWHGMTTDVRRVIATCKLCERVRATPPNAVQEMQTPDHGEYGMFYRWGLDYLGELPPSELGSRYALIAIDYFSKWIEVFPLPAADSATTVRTILLHLIARYGVPAEFCCDNGSPFLGEFEKFCNEKQIDIHFITAGVPRSNGLAERAVQTVKRALQKYAAIAKNAYRWDIEGLASILLGYRCTTQRSSGLTPAQVLFAQDPAVTADKWVSRGGPVDFDNVEAAADELLVRAELAREISLQVVENLRLAHARNAARFKALRSGLYRPRVSHFQVGDFVYFVDKNHVRGGALGIPVHDEILRVVEVRPSGVLLLENQGGRQFPKHIENLVPCNLSNVEGTVHPELIKPSWNFPCSVCNDPRHGSRMLLCDGCNMGYHTYCLTPPLDDIPEGIWICPTCIQFGVTEAQVVDRRERYIPVEESRPYIELPSPQRRAKARRLAAEWHGKAVRQTTKAFDRVGRLFFTGVSEMKWFQIAWMDGTTTLHDSRILARLEVLPENEAPAGLSPVPAPVTVLTVASEMAWSVQTADDIRRRLTAVMPGRHLPLTIERIHASFTRRERKRLTVQSPPDIMDLLLACVNVSVFRVALDPWAGDRMVTNTWPTDGPALLTNDKLARHGVQLTSEPLEPALYRKVIKAMGRLDCIVMAPPLLLADFALTTALEFASAAVLMCVPYVWYSSPHAARRTFLKALEREHRMVMLADPDPSVQLCWVCVFPSVEDRDRCILPGLLDDTCTIWMQYVPGPINL
jgi:transposase InsO family protein